VAGEFTGTTTRGVLSRCDRLPVAVRRAAGVGLADRCNDEDQLPRRHSRAMPAAAWDTLDTATKTFLVDELAGQNALVSGPYIPDGDAKLTYEAGIAESNTLCLRVIGFPDEDSANAAYQQILGGADFAEIADASNTDPGTRQGWRLHRQHDQQPMVCRPMRLNQQVGQVLAPDQDRRSRAAAGVHRIRWHDHPVLRLHATAVGRGWPMSPGP